MLLIYLFYHHRQNAFMLLFIRVVSLKMLFIMLSASVQDYINLFRCKSQFFFIYIYTISSATQLALILFNWRQKDISVGNFYKLCIWQSKGNEIKCRRLIITTFLIIILIYFHIARKIISIHVTPMRFCDKPGLHSLAL